MERFRTNRLDRIKTFLGANHSDNGAKDNVPVNVIEQYVLVMLRLLVSQDPQALVTTRHSKLKPMGADLETWMNWRIREMKLVDTLRLVAMDALFSIGLMKIGLTQVPESTWEGTTHYYLEPYADHIDLDDFVIDMRAKHRSQVAYIGHRYLMPLEEARNNPRFDKDLREKLQPTRYTQVNERGDERIKNIEHDPVSSFLDNYCEYVELYELYLPREQRVVTAMTDDSGRCFGSPLSADEFIGPRSGPYHFLTFVDVPSNVMPAAPVANRIDMADAINANFRKLIRQSLRQKKCTAFQNQADAIRVRDAEDGDGVHVDQPNMLKEFVNGGIDQANFLFNTQLLEIFNKMAGNIELLGGLSQQAQTLGQEELLQGNSSAQLKDMQARMVGFVRDAIGSNGLAWYWFHSDETYEGERTVEGVEFSTEYRITPEQRQSNFSKLNFDVNPYSLQGQTPQEQVAKIDQMVKEIILPATPVLQAAGAIFNVEGYLRLRAKLTNMPYLSELITFSTPPMMEEQPADEPPRMAMETTRNYVRQSVPQGTTPGKTAALMQTLGGTGQPADLANAMGSA